MEPFEWLLLGAGLALGGLFGANSKGVMRSAAKGYLLLEEKTRNMTATVREDFRDAVEEARYERAQEELLREEAAIEAALDSVAVEGIYVLDSEPAPAQQARRAPRARKATADAPRSGSRSQASPADKPARKRGPKAAGTRNGAEGAGEAAPSETAETA